MSNTKYKLSYDEVRVIVIALVELKNQLIAEGRYSDPEEAARFSRESYADAMAVAIGNAHGVYKAEPKLRFDILEEIRDQSGLPLVLHGGSGISDADFQKAIRCGIRKVNIATASFMKTAEYVQCYMHENIDSRPYYFDMSEAMVQGTYENVKHHIRVFSLLDMDGAPPFQ